MTRLARSMERDFDRRLKPLGITRGAFAVLSAIHHDGKAKPAELASYLGLDGAAITRYLDRVEELGLIERKPSPTDRRSTDIKLTAEGRKVVGLGQTFSQATNEKFMAGFTAAEVESLQSALRTILANSDITIANL